jgi:hypothetical protein
MEEKGELVSLYLKVKRGVKERLEKTARERGYTYLADFAGELLEKALGEPRRKELERPEAAQRLIGTWRLKTCRFLGEDGYCSAWELPRDEAERIYGEEAKELLELRVVEHSTWFGVERVEEYGLKPTPSLCFHCPFFERK